MARILTRTPQLRRKNTQAGNKRLIEGRCCLILNLVQQ